MKKVFLSFLSIISILLITGCGSKEIKENKEEVKQVEPNTKVGYLNFYAPLDFDYRKDLKGLLYSENEKKVYIKGDYENDFDNVIYLISVVEKQNMGGKQYIDSVNSRLSENDVKFVLKSNGKIIEIYSRENYVIGTNVNYAYITEKDGYIHTVNIKGPKDKSDEISKIANDIYLSLNKKLY